MVAQGKTTMARATFRPRNLLFSTRASMKPSTVEITTTAMVQTMVFFSTRVKVGLFRTFVKFSKLLKPRSWPVRLTLFRDRWNTERMGARMKTAIRMTLGAIQI